MGLQSPAWRKLRKTVKPYTPQFLVTSYRAVCGLFNVSPYPDVERKATRELPVLIYQMGKVGSRSIAESLNEVDGLDVFHAHRLGTDIHPNLNQRVLAGNERLRIITMVRDPISRNLSSYYHLLDNHFKTKDAHLRFSAEEISQHFFGYIKEDIEDSIGWFDTEFRTKTGVDVYQYSFPYEQKWQVIKQGLVEILILRVDLDDAGKAAAISSFLGIDGFELARSNVGKARANGAQYRDFVKTVELPEAYLDRNLDSRFAKHFFSTEELRDIRSKWSKN